MVKRNSTRTLLIVVLSCSLLIVGPVGVSAREHTPPVGDGQVLGATNGVSQTETPTDETGEFREEWPDRCSEAPVMNTTGVYGGVILSPTDRDTFKIEMGEKGTYVTVAPVAPAIDGATEFQARDEGRGTGRETSVLNVNEGNGRFTTFDDDNYRLESAGEGLNGSSFQIWADIDGPVICFFVDVESPEASALPYEWQVRIVENDPEPQPVTGSQLPPSDDEQEIAELRNRTEALQQRIAELEDRVAALEASSNETG